MNIKITQRSKNWCAMSSDCITGPYFFDENVCSQNHVHMLDTFLWPIIQRKRQASKILFQQDGAPAHYSLKAKYRLNDRLPNKWIGRDNDKKNWPSRPPDLNSCDFFLLGNFKQRVYNPLPKTLDDLRSYIKIKRKHPSYDAGSHF